MLKKMDFEDLQCFFSGTKHLSGTRGLGARSPQRVSAQSALAGFRGEAPEKILTFSGAYNFKIALKNDI